MSPAKRGLLGDIVGEGVSILANPKPFVSALVNNPVAAIKSVAAPIATDLRKVSQHSPTPTPTPAPAPAPAPQSPAPAPPAHQNPSPTPNPAPGGGGGNPSQPITPSPSNPQPAPPGSNQPGAGNPPSTGNSPPGSNPSIPIGIGSGPPGSNPANPGPIANGGPPTVRHDPSVSVGGQSFSSSNPPAGSSQSGQSSLGSTPSSGDPSVPNTPAPTSTLGSLAIPSVGSGNKPGSVGTASTSHHKGLPPVAIGLISAALILIALFGTVFAIRRVYQRRRADRRTRWAPVMAQTGGPALDGSSSVRSSFATTVDYGLRAQSPLPAVNVPPVPPVPHIAEPKRISAGSDQSQWLVVDRPKSSEDLLGGTGLLTPLSVRPFSPSESYKFPQPPRTSSPDASPFADAASPVSPTDSNLVIAKGFSVTIKRPFAPSLPDEMYVTPGQVVVIEEMFDDGWNLVKSTDGARGLVPLACFEDLDQPKGKRRSSLMESLK